MIIIGKRYSFFKKCDFSPSLLMQASWVLWLNEIVRSLTTLFIILTRDMALLLKATYIPTKTEVGFEGSPYRPVLQYFHGGTVVLTYEYCSTLLIELNESSYSPSLRTDRMTGAETLMVTGCMERTDCK